MGSLTIDLAWIAAIVAVLVALAGAALPERRAVAQRVARVALVSSTALTGLAVAVLGHALWTVDPALAYVARHSSDKTPLAYRIAGIWGGMEGSLLFWAFIVTCTFAIAAARQSYSSAELLAVVGVGGATTATFLFVGRTWASPFERLDAPTGAGEGLLAVLQHPAMVYHPPILYIGLALTGVPFALTLLALFQRRVDQHWRSRVVPWVRAGWLVLAVGIVTGSQWAYAELGWGGFWAWDPVENSSLLPWLAATVALHLLADSGGRLRLSAAVAIVAAFCMMVCGVYVTRSGTTGSIHAFSESPEVGRPLLVFAATTAIVSIAALARHGSGFTDGRAPIRVRALQAHSVLGAIAIVAIALGTFWPVLDGLVFSDVGTRALVRPQYYHRALAPIVALSLVAMAIGPVVALSDSRSWRQNLQPLAIVSIAGAIVVPAVTIVLVGSGDWLTIAPLVVMASAGVAIAGSIQYGVKSARARRRHSVGVAVAHCGFAFMLLGAVASSGGSDDTVRIAVGESVEFGSTTSAGVTGLELVELTTGTSGRYEFVRGTLDVADGQQRQRYFPELRAYERQRIPTAEAVIDGSLRGDTIVVLESVSDDLASATFTVRTRPLLPWVWFGALLVVGGGLATLAGPRPTSPTGPDATADPVAATQQR